MEAPCKKSVKLTPPSSSSCLISNMSSPILMEILCRVPIRTLASCNCVCKSWLHLIKDPHFPQLHQARAPTEVCFQCYHYDENATKLHLGNFNLLGNFGPRDVKFKALCDVPKFNVKPNNELNPKSIRGNIHFANSCNGLLCFGSNSFAVVCNPCTGEFVTFPAPNVVKDVSNCRGYGFGFSAKANKYKLLRVIGRKDLAEGVVAEICVIEKALSWKAVSPCPSGVWLPQKKDKLYTTFLQGTLHWFSAKVGYNSGTTLLTFDFEDDQFGSIPLPFGEISWGSDSLGVLAGCLCITGMTCEGTAIWLMKEYGVQDSWTKLFWLGSIVHKGPSYGGYLPISYMDNGEVLMTCTSFASTIVFCYNPVLKSIRFIGSAPSSLRVISFRPSLALLTDSMLGYKVRVKPRCAETPLHWWWEPMEEKKPQQHGSKAPLINDKLSVRTVEEGREGGVSATSEVAASESPTTMLAHQQGTEAPTTGTPATDLACQQGSKTLVATDETCASAARDDPLERIKSVMEEVLEDLRKEREQRQELEGRLENELAKVEPLKDQTEQLKQENQELEERLQDEHAKVEQLKKKIQQSEQLKQENRQTTVQMVDEMRARLLGSH